MLKKFKSMQHFENQVYFKCPDAILIQALTTADHQIRGCATDTNQQRQIMHFLKKLLWFKRQDVTPISARHLVEFDAHFSTMHWKRWVANDRLSFPSSSQITKLDFLIGQMQNSEVSAVVLKLYIFCRFLFSYSKGFLIS